MWYLHMFVPSPFLLVIDENQANEKKGKVLCRVTDAHITNVTKRTQ